MHDKIEIFEKVDEVVKLMLEKFPECHYTTTIRLWDDGDYSVECRHGSMDNLCHNIRYHKSVDSFTYESYQFLSSAVKESCDGKQYYIPNELIGKV